MLRAAVVMLFVGVAYARDTAVTVTDSLRTIVVSGTEIRPDAVSRFLLDHAPARRPQVLHEYLDSLGHFDAVWDTTDHDTLVVHTGRRARIDSVTITAKDLAVTADSLDYSHLPRFYTAETVSSFARAAVRFAARRGYPFAAATIQLNTRKRSSSDGSRYITVHIDLEPGRPALFGSPSFPGNPMSRPQLLANDIAFDHGEPFDLASVEESRKRLQSRNYVDDVQVGAPLLLPPPHDLHSPSDSVDTVTIPFHVFDRSGLGLDGALAYASDLQTDNRLSGTFDLTLLNIFGRGETASLHYRGEQTYNKMEIAVSKPHLFGMPLVGSAEFGLELERESYGYLHGELELLYEPATLWQTGFAVSAHEATDETFDTVPSWRYYGFDLVTRRLGEPRRAGNLSRWLSLKAGTGMTADQGKRQNRFRLDLRGGLQVPFAGRHALAVNLVGQTAVAQSGERLHEVELFRTGGHGSLRGYLEDEFAFQTVGYAQLEYLYYFSRIGSVYIFSDGGVGFPREFRPGSEHRTGMLGYGLGIRAPIGSGTISLEWARSIADHGGFGRIHVRIRNTIARNKSAWQN
ncbi:MAG: hypothetical protein GF344_02555 [Chitinivibrionales bacterium]|nr:hypothetical protein [Chitinivibrionales bacterium]MBD3355967.1 hypothetical protein [Chitinivibrionales bacterium]